MASLSVFASKRVFFKLPFLSSVTNKKTPLISLSSKSKCTPLFMSMEKNKTSPLFMSKATAASDDVVTVDEESMSESPLSKAEASADDKLLMAVNDELLDFVNDFVARIKAKIKLPVETYFIDKREWNGLCHAVMKDKFQEDYVYDKVGFNEGFTFEGSPSEEITFFYFLLPSARFVELYVGTKGLNFFVEGIKTPLVRKYYDMLLEKDEEGDEGTA